MIKPSEDITVVVLTRNEQCNIAKALESVRWAKSVLVVDSFSEDNTANIAVRFSNVSIVEHAFSNHASQWNYAVTHNSIVTEWVLCLDADYEVPAEFVKELMSISLHSSVMAMSCGFEYRINGESIGSNIYGSKPVMFRRGGVLFSQQGHTQVPTVAGDIVTLGARIIHDDRKSVSTWVQSQLRYADLESEYLVNEDGARTASGYIRRWPRISVFVVLCYLVIGKGLLFKGKAGFDYFLQRLIAEALIAKAVLNRQRPRKLAIVTGVEQTNSVSKQVDRVDVGDRAVGNIPAKASAYTSRTDERKSARTERSSRQSWHRGGFDSRCKTKMSGRVVGSGR